MAQDEWISEQAGPSWLGRLVSPGSSRPGTVPFLALGATVVAYVCSLVLDWVGATGGYKLGQNDDQTFINIYGAEATIDSARHATLVVSNNVTGMELVGLVYGLGGLALLAIGFAVLSRPDLALRLRMAAAGLGLGVLGVVIAAAVKLPKFLLVNGSAYASGSLESIDRSFKPGIFCAVAVAVLPVLAVWIRSAPAARSAILAEEAARVAPAPSSPAASSLALPNTAVSGPALAGPAFAGPAFAGPAVSGPATDASVVWSQRDPDDGRWRRASSAPFDLTVTPDD